MTPEQIADLRMRLGMSQSEFARALGLSRQATVSDWERGTETPSQTAVILMLILEKDGKRRS